MGLNPGTYTAFIKDYGFSEPKEGKNPSALVQFEVITELGPETIMWFGSFNGGALPITLRTLVETLGFKGRTGAELAQGAGSNMLSEQQQYELDLALEEYQGVTRLKVKGIYLPGAARVAAKLSAQQAAVFVGGINLAGELAAMRQKMGKPATTQQPPARQPLQNHAPQTQGFNPNAPNFAPAYTTPDDTDVPF